MGSRGLRRSAEKERVWRDRLREHAGSGVSIRAFCRDKGIPECHFYRWRRELSYRDQEGRKRVSPARSRVRGTSFALVSTASGDGAAGVSPGHVEVVLANGRRVRVGREVDAERLREIVTALSRP